MKMNSQEKDKGIIEQKAEPDIIQKSKENYRSYQIKHKSEF